MTGTMEFGKYPFPPDRKRPIHIRGDLIRHFIYPLDNPLFSDLNYMFVSTDRFQFCTFQLGPGGVFEPADVHAGDEVYYILDGTITLENPMLGQCVQAKKGETLLLPKDAWHKGYNFEQEIVRILAIIAPRAWEDDLPPAGFDSDKEKRYKHSGDNALPEQPAILRENVVPTVDDLGRWPVPGPEARQAPVRFYHIPEDRRLLTVHGTEYPMLVRFMVSNDLLHVGEFVLPAGGTSARVSEPDKHDGDLAVYVEKGPITFFLPETNETFDVQEEEVMFVPEGVWYRLINYTAGVVRGIFAVAPDL